jgi:nicotinamidase-related amidase
VFDRNNLRLSDLDKQVIASSGHAVRRGLGAKPAVLIVDAQEHFVGTKEPILDSIRKYPTSVGLEAWAAVAQIARLLEAARSLKIPVMYTMSGFERAEESFDSFARKRRDKDVAHGVPTIEVPIVADIAPRPGEVVIKKRYPSAFFGTPLISFLHAGGIDTLLLAGFTTGGCVRASCVDAMSYNLNVGVVADGCADRLQIAHDASLLDMDMKYGDVVHCGEAVDYLRGVQR